MDDKHTTIQQIRQKIQSFSDDRGWTKDQNPKDLAMALSVETGELIEIFQWIHSDMASSIKDDPKEFEHLKEEVADVFWYLVRICEHFDIDLADAVEQKSVKNAMKYSISK